MKTLFFFLLLAGFSLPAFPQGVQRTLGYSGDQSGFFITSTSDGGYMLAGRGAGALFLVKIDSSANVLWSGTFDAVYQEACYICRQTSDGGYAACGWSNSGSSQDIYVLKLDASYAVQWSVTYGGSDSELGYDMQLTPDGGYIVAASTFGGVDNDAYLLKLDANGAYAWDRVIGGSNWEEFYSVDTTSDGGYIFSGRTRSFGAGGSDIYLVKTDASGNLLWSKTIGGGNEDYGNSVRQSADGGFIIGGWSNSFSNSWSDLDCFLCKTDADGNIQWFKTFGGPDYEDSYSVCRSPDGGYLVPGGTRSFGAGATDAYLVRTDASGNLLWSKAYGGAGTDYAYSALPRNNGGFAVLGYTDGFAAQGTDFYLFFTDSAGVTECNEWTAATTQRDTLPVVTVPADNIASGGVLTNLSITPGNPAVVDTTACIQTGIGAETENPNGNYFSLYPNPVHGKTVTLHFSGTAPRAAEITVMDIAGRILEKINTPAGTGNTCILDVSGRENGLYLLRVNTGKKCRVEKLLLLR